jgi:2-polyprenyl-3-methyl-5-hydroxy-6-metoxy-1,4-benzoquinol methylase
MKETKERAYYVDYTSHDVPYRKNREEGLPGWNDAEKLAEHITQLTRIFAREEIPRSGRVLDIGCGAGNISFWLETLGYSVTGIDVSSVAIEWAMDQARLSNSQVKFSVDNAAQGNYRAGELFDIVLDNNCLHCIIGEDRKLYLSNIFDNLKPAGCYICNTMCDEIRDKEILPFFDPVSRCYIRGNLAIRYIGTHNDIIKEITSAGFELLYEESTSCNAQDSMCLIARKLG